MNGKISQALKKQNRQASEQKQKVKNRQAPAHDALELIFTIVNRNKAEFYIDIMQSFDVNIQLVLPGSGTADAGMLEMFGLTDSDKAVIIGVINQKKIPDALYALDYKFRTIRNGKGIAYTVPLSGVIGTLIYGFLCNNKLAVKPDSRTDNGDKK